MKKRIIATLLAGIMALSLAACGAAPAAPAAPAEPAKEEAEAPAEDAAEEAEAEEAEAPAAEAGEKPVVKVAVMCPESGENARMGELYKAAITAAMKVVEEDNMLNDYTLEFEYIDDKCTTEGAPIAANYALDQYGCNISIGHLLTTMILADGQYFEDAETTLLGIVSGPASVAQGWEYVSIETGTDYSAADSLIDYLMTEVGSENIGLVNINTEGGMSAADEIERYLKEKYGKDLATHDQMTNEDTDYTSIALNMKNANVDTVIFWGLTQSAGQLCYTAVQQYVGELKAFCGGTNLAQSQCIDTWKEEDLDGVLFPVGYIPDPTNELQPRIREYFTAADPQGQEIADVPARVVDAVFHICTALNNLGPADPTADGFNADLNKQIRAAAFDGVQGHFDFSANTNGVGLNVMNIGHWVGYTQEKIK